MWGLEYRKLKVDEDRCGKVSWNMDQPKNTKERDLKKASLLTDIT